MQARRAARELAFILFSQLNEKINNYNKENTDDLILKSVRILTENAQDNLKISLGTLIDTKNRIEDYESEHQTNLNRPIGAANIAVPMPSTKDVLEKIEEMIDVAEKSVMALEVAEFVTLDSQNEVKNYAMQIVEQYNLHHDEIDDLISKHAQGWDFDRLVKMDKDILRIAICELLFINGTPMKVAVDEALELAKKYSTEDSSAFINGILAKIITEKGL